MMDLIKKTIARLRKNLTAALFIVVGIVLIATIWVFIYLRLEFDQRQILENSKSNLQNIVRSFKEHTESSIAISDELLRIIKFNYEKSDKIDFKTLNDYFKNGVLDMQYFNQVGVIDKDGLYSYTNMKDQKKIDLSDREHFKIHKDPYPYGLYVSKPVLGRVSKRWSIQLTRRINGADGSFNGVAVVSFDPLYFLNFYKKIDLGTDGFIALVDLDGFVRTIETGNLSSIDGKVNRISLSPSIVQSTVGVEISDQIFDGIKRVYAYERIADQPLLVIVGIKESVALKEYQANRATYLSFGWTLTILIILFTSLSIFMILRARALNETLKKINLEAEKANLEKIEFANRLTQSEKLAALGQLSAGVAHEINNPIGYVGSNINTMKKYFEQFENIINTYKSSAEFSNAPPIDTENLEFMMQDSRHLIEETQEGIGRVKSIIDDLKNFSRADANKNWERCDLHKAIRSTLNIVNNEIKYSADVSLELGSIPMVECIPSQINQVILNLIVNAAQATRAGTRGIITIRTYAQQTLHNINALDPLSKDAGEDAQFVAIEIQDQGQGISEENLSKIFDPFFTTKSIGVGTGLGLSVSHGIIQRHDGEIKVTSVLDEGCCFKIVLPVHQTRANS
jgi:signal transduction histidine kinase